MAKCNSGKSIGTLLAQRGWMTEEELLAALAEKLQVPLLRDLESEGVDPTLVSKVPITFTRKHKIVPLRIEDGLLTRQIPCIMSLWMTCVSFWAVPRFAWC